ncbi:MAG: neutral zinc metallopeptidase [Propionibacteriaceae bacterium]|nr:neutral zinc metallopeptidase [Propionibacteriaceae bacterium]
MSFQSGGNFKGGRVKRAGGGRSAGVAGGGLGIVVIALVAYFLGVDPALIEGALDNTGITGSGSGVSGYIGACTAEQANTDRQCRLSATVQALDAYWTKTLPAQTNVKYTPPDVVSFDGQTQSRCGVASAATGPFYCPADQTIYVDVAFFDRLSSRYGASGGPLGEMYVVAHEMGHHIEYLIGALHEADNDEGANSDSVRIELEADCFAGMWAGGAATTVDPNTGTTFLEPITQAQLKDALSAAAAVGDDHIQKTQAGYVNPDTFTHGTSQQRMNWFTTGYEKGKVASCDVLHAKNI